MTNLNFKGFFDSGAFLQIGPDSFQVLLGPFQPINLADIGAYPDETLLYHPKFWDFLKTGPQSGQNLVYRGLSSKTLDREEFIHLLEGYSSEQPVIQWKVPLEEDFASQFSWSQNQFSENKLEKSVPIICQAGSARLSDSHLIWCLRSLLSLRDYGWSYGFFEKGSGSIGHTPEMLTDWNSSDQIIKTMALAGTYPKGNDATFKMKSDAKIQREHRIVVDDILLKLSGLDVTCAQTLALELKYLLHFKTDIEVQANSLDEVFSIIQRLHPTSAMGLFPSDIQKLVEFSNFDLQNKRDDFAAPFGMLNSAGFKCVVAIRNLKIAADQVSIFSGCGVTAESNYAMEIEELVHKRNSVKRMLGLNIE